MFPISEDTFIIIYTNVFLLPIAVFFIYVLYKINLTRYLKSKYPNHPWKHYPKWKDGKIQPKTNTGIAVFNISLSAYIAIIFGIPIQRAYIEGQIPSLTLLLAIIAFIGLFVVLLLFQGIKALWLVLKYGKIHFQMADETGVVGGRLVGLIHIPRQLNIKAGFNISLRCVEVIRTQSGKNTRTKENIIWEDSKTTNKDALSQDTSVTGIPVLFSIPHECVPFHDWIAVNYYTKKCIIWRLWISADLPGLDFQNSFEVPVFKTTNNSQNTSIDESKYEEYTHEPTLEESLQNTRILIQNGSNSVLQITFLPRFSPILQYITAPTALIVYLLAQWKAVKFIIDAIAGTPAQIFQLKVIIPIFVVSVFLIIFLLIFLGNNMYQSQIKIHKRGVDILYTFLIFNWRKHFSLNHVKQFSIKADKLSGRTIQPYKLIAETDKKPETITRVIPGKHLAELLKQKLNETLVSLKN